MPLGWAKTLALWLLAAISARTAGVVRAFLCRAIHPGDERRRQPAPSSAQPDDKSGWHPCFFGAGVTKQGEWVHPLPLSVTPAGTWRQRATIAGFDTGATANDCKSRTKRSLPVRQRQEAQALLPAAVGACRRTDGA